MLMMTMHCRLPLIGLRQGVRGPLGMACAAAAPLAWGVAVWNSPSLKFSTPVLRFNLNFPHKKKSSDWVGLEFDNHGFSSSHSTQNSLQTPRENRAR
jgi:hypothetical protein